VWTAIDSFGPPAYITDRSVINNAIAAPAAATPDARIRQTMHASPPAEHERHIAITFKSAIAVALVLTVAACSRPAPAPEPVRAVQTLTVAGGLAGGTVEYAGEVRARVESRLGFRVGGKMVSRPAQLGERVRAGQVLATLDVQDLRLGQEAARSAVQAARVSHDQALADYKRFSELRDQGFISAAELERRDNTLKAAQAQLAQAEAMSGMQTNQASYGSLVADASGVVTAVEAEPGAVLSAGATVLRVAQDGPRDVVFSVPEDQIGALRALQGRAGAVQVRVWGDSKVALPASVREVAAAADPATRTYAVKADVGTAAVRLGQTASVSVAVPSVAGVVKLPLAAVFEQQGKSSVWLLDPATMTVRAQPIVVGGADGNQIIVAAGLAPGQQVVTAGVHVLTPGQQVTRYGAAPVLASAAASESAR
jgi:multidrug efflux system membrane fusion protein